MDVLFRNISTSYLCYWKVTSYPALVLLQSVRGGRLQSNVGKQWWLVILIRFLVAFSAYTSLSSYIPFYLIVVIALFLGSGIAFYFDRRYVSAHSSWTPSAWHYLLVLPTIGEIVAVVYLYKRYRHVGLGV